MSMSLRKLEAEGAKKTGMKHGVYAYLKQGKLPSGRAWKRAQREISQLREALIAQYGGESIRPDVLSLLESAIEGLMIQRLSSLYVKKAGIMRRDSMRRGDLQLHSVLSGQFISYANLVRLNLEAAARLAGQKGPELPAPTIAEIIREVDAEAAAKAKEAAAGGPGLAQDGRTAAGQDGGKDREGADPGGNGQGGGKRASRIDGDGRSLKDEDQDTGETDAPPGANSKHKENEHA